MGTSQFTGVMLESVDSTIVWHQVQGGYRNTPSRYMLHASKGLAPFLMVHLVRMRTLP